MKFDVLGLLAACSYALDCVEAELIKVTNNHCELLRLLNSRASYWAPIESGLFLCFSYPAAVVFRGMPLLPVA